MAANHLNELYSSRVRGDKSNISYGSLIRWRVKTIRAGNMQIVKAYPARVDYTQPRKVRSKPSREAQKKLNDRNRSEQFRLLLLTNFSNEDLFATLTFAQEPEDKTKALEKLKYFLKKLRKASTGEIKYLGVIETQNTGCDAVRCHIHLVISGRDYEAIKKNWIYGNTKIQKMKDALDAAGYLSKTFAQCRRENITMCDPEISKILTSKRKRWIQGIYRIPRSWRRSSPVRKNMPPFFIRTMS